VVTQPYLKTLRFPTHSSRSFVQCPVASRLDANPDGHPIDGTLAINELKEWVARAYRYYIWDGVKFYINGQELKSHDPLYLRPQDTNFPSDPPATIRLDETIAWPLPKNALGTSNIRIVVTLLPEQLRPFRGAGGTTEARIRRIDVNEGISILRHKREVAFGNFYPIVPALEDIDRWWGCEIHFEPALDEWWQVRNIKRGARPVEQLRNRLKSILNNPDEVAHDRLIMRIRQEIRTYWDLIEQNTNTENGTDTTNEDGQETDPSVNAAGSDSGTNTNTGTENGIDTTNEDGQETDPSVDAAGSDSGTNTNTDSNVENEPATEGGRNRPRGTPPPRPQITLISAREPEQIVERMCKRFHLIAQQLTTRHNGRPTLEITDEYDVQDLLHALLKLEFDDVRPEEWTPSYAGGSSRMDFLLNKEKIVIEVKKTRNNMNARTLGEELIIDIHRYQSHPRCRTLICFVFDPDNRITNPRGLENDLSRYYNGLKVEVYITPS